MPTGTKPTEVLRRFEALRGEDATYASGCIVVPMGTAPRSVVDPRHRTRGVSKSAVHAPTR